ncbi:serine/threonine-protein kinase Nek1-like isoform X2 [Clavelina lepadiformis]|uniref:serine/threonine-protein kinase Nek1-like isoform X2 n=1 Tax=Clavelina lepadiformis TaxID=159417 RepID=UPI00404113AD
MDKYTKIKKIGEGSFGKAILVKHKETGHQYVVKEIGISKMKPKERNEARKEVTVLSKMRHPNIVQYTESFEEDGHLFIVMEYCEGGDLYALINKQKGVFFSEQQVLSWFVQLCLALKHVHDRKILHRDIKTSNIFLTKSGSLKLGDFGIARVLNNTMELARTCIGTPYYLSPEICENKPYNNKSDVWALGCVVYETLTLKHAFEAGNMKNLVLKIIRGSYPPVPSRYSYDLRSLVSQLFRRNPRERPSINSILRKPFLSSLTERFLSPEQYEDEFSHTVLHKGRPRPSSAKPSRYQPPAAKRLQNIEVKGSAVGVRNRRDQQIAAAYGPSVAVKKPKLAAPRPGRVVNAQRAVDDILEKKRQQLVEEEKKRKEKLAEEKKKRLEDLQKRQRDRALRVKEEQMKRARDEARMMNLKRSADLLDPKQDDRSYLSVGRKEPSFHQHAGRERPISAPKEKGDYDKYHEYLNHLEQGNKPAAAEFAAPGLNRVKAAWDERNKAQNAILAAHANRLVGEQAAGQAKIVSEYLQRKQEAQMNKQKGNLELYRNNDAAKKPKLGVAAALQPYSAASAKAGNPDEKQYLSRLHQIRQQNYNDRKALQNKIKGNQNAYKVALADDELTSEAVQRKKKIEALQQQAEDRAKMLKEKMMKRREILDARQERKNLEEMEEKRKLENLARARGIIPPDERPVKYNPNPIGITQALFAVGAPIVQAAKDEEKAKGDEVSATNEVLSPSRPEGASLRKQILKRVNERYSIDFEEEDRKLEVEESRTRQADAASQQKDGKEKPAVKPAWDEKPGARPLPVLPEKTEASKPPAWKQWGDGGDIGAKIAGLPLQETASQMEATVLPPTLHEKPALPKRQWNVPSGTFVQRLNQMTIQAPTMTLPSDGDKEQNDGLETSPVKESDTNNKKKDEQNLQSVKEDKPPNAQDHKSVSSLIKAYGGGRPLPMPKPSINNATIVIKSVDAVQPNNPAPSKQLAANFTPVPKNGTYVIKSIDIETPEIVTKSVDVGSENTDAKVKDSLEVEKQSNDALEADVVERNPPAKLDLKEEVPAMQDEAETDKLSPEESSKSQKSSSPKESPKSKAMEDTTASQTGSPKSGKSDEEDIEVVELTEGIKNIASLDDKPVQQASAWTSQEPSPTKPALPPRPTQLPNSPKKSPSSSEEADPHPESPDHKSHSKDSSKRSSPTSPQSRDVLQPPVSESPFFSKVNRATRINNLATSPLPKQDTPMSASPLSKSLYRTANDQMLMKLTLGHFDSPNPKFLRTCSLPDLTSAASKEEEEEDEVGFRERKHSSQLQDAENDPQELFVAVSMNDTNFDEDEEVDFGSTVDDAVATDDEELDVMRANLENALLINDDGGSASPPYSAGHQAALLLEDVDDSDEGVDVINEEWQSDSDSFADDCDKDGSDNGDDSDTGSVFCRLERNREQLERDLGLEKFLEAYRCVQAIHEDADEEMAECERRVRAVLGEKHDLLYQRIRQLVLADGAYCEDND